MDKSDGLQKYFIRESSGELTHSLEQPGKMNVTFKTIFDKVNSQNDYLNPSLHDIYVRQEIILKPIFKQIIAENVRSEGVIFHHTLYGLTKVTFFPFPEYGNTIYLFETDDKLLIPIGYAIYRESS